LAGVLAVADLDAVPVIEQDAVGAIRCGDRSGIITGTRGLSALDVELTGVQPQGSVVVELVAGCHAVRAGGRDEHVLVRLAVSADHGLWQRSDLGDADAFRDDGDVPGDLGGDLRLAEVLVDDAGDRDEVADLTGDALTVEVDEDAV